MEHYREILTVAAILVGLAGYAPYIAGILKGITTPHVFSWTIWCILTFIGFFAQLDDKAGPGAWVTGITAGLCGLIVILAFIKEHKNLDITRSDVWVFIGTLLAIPLWYLTGDPFWSVILITAIDTAAFYPTFRKTYFKPEGEVLFAYTMSAIKFFLSILALENFTTVTVLYPASLVLSNAAFVAMVMWRRRMLQA